jgi:hypothetical protein
MNGRSTSRAAKAVWIAVVVLALLHWDFWYWDDATLLFGFLPVGLAYQALFSVAACLVWVAAVRYAWPEPLEAWADEVQPRDGEHTP